jgi:diadenosine tetraphosphatase ApaH/serine/threonine PP2A family protein phosphatase
MEDGISLKNSQKLVENVSMVNQDIILCGHSHIPRTVYLPTGQLVINPGSVGLPAYTDDVPYPHRMETGSPHTRYSLLIYEEKGWLIENIAVPYNWEAASMIALNNKRPDWAKWLKEGRT